MPSKAYKHYLLGVLTVILIFKGLDRVTLGVVLQSIKTDLQLSDTQLGLLSGIAFALFYSIMGVPIARWADRGNRVAIIAIAASFWSAAVASSAAAVNFIQLLLIRVVVGVGESGCVPPSYSLIADYFSRAERPRAAALYGLGAPLSSAVGFFLAGWLNELYGWRTTFILLGLPGLGLAALAWFTVREPRRADPNWASVARVEGQPTMREVCVTLWSNTTFRHLLLSLSVMFFFIYGIFVWLPALFIRSYGMTTGEIGMWLALTYGMGGVAGTYLGGTLAARYAANNERAQLRFSAAALALAGALSVCAYLPADRHITLGLIAFSSIALTIVNGPMFATIQTLVPERMRAVSFALIYLFANLIGSGLGPLAAGALSDALQSSAGQESLRYALLLLSPGYFWAAWHAWRAGRTVAGDLARC